jgi:hypothetical protein
MNLIASEHFAVGLSESLSRTSIQVWLLHTANAFGVIAYQAYFSLVFHKVNGPMINNTGSGRNLKNLKKPKK